MTVYVLLSQVWAAWVDPHNKPVRACVAAPMAHPDILVEVMVTAAKLKRSKYITAFAPPRPLRPTPPRVWCNCASDGPKELDWLTALSSLAGLHERQRGHLATVAWQAPDDRGGAMKTAAYHRPPYQNVQTHGHLVILKCMAVARGLQPTHSIAFTLSAHTVE
jgi:hypothetical protein